MSARIVSYTDWKLAQQCYGTLHDEGVSIRKALTKFSFAHQKYWIIDNKEVHLSTGQLCAQRERERERRTGGAESTSTGDTRGHFFLLVYSLEVHIEKEREGAL